VFHGVATAVKQTNPDYLFDDLPEEITVGRYHSWVIAKENLPNDLIITAVDETGQIMSLKHQTHDVRGVQFHPESVLTPHGQKIIENWVNFKR
jgi:anthranilate synthase component 2